MGTGHGTPINKEGTSQRNGKPRRASFFFYKKKNHAELIPAGQPTRRKEDGCLVGPSALLGWTTSGFTVWIARAIPSSFLHIRSRTVHVFERIGQGLQHDQPGFSPARLDRTRGTLGVGRRILTPEIGCFRTRSIYILRFGISPTSLSRAAGQTAFDAAALHVQVLWSADQTDWVPPCATCVHSSWLCTSTLWLVSCSLVTWVMCCCWVLEDK
jgi:hypothetical protein